MEIIVRNHTHSEVKTLDDAGHGGGHHLYQVKNFHPDMDRSFFHEIKFQKGPMEEDLPNGLHNEDLLYIVKHRLECFQVGTFACLENAAALNAVNKAIEALGSRTKDRRARDVEGKSVL